MRSLSALARRVPTGLRRTFEICTRVGPWVASVTAKMSAGVALFIDYGLPRREYFHPQRDTGTLRAHYRQRALDSPFAHPGLEDLTAWVDFTRVAEAADAAGLEVLGFATQAALLLALGIEAQWTRHPMNARACSAPASAPAAHAGGDGRDLQGDRRGRR